MRAGAHALSLLAVPLNVYVLTALEEEPKSLVELRRVAGSPPQTTMRGHLRRLTELGIVERTQRNDFPGNLDYELGTAGHELLPVVHIVNAWLALAPEGPVTPASSTAKSSIKALVEGWSTSIVRALAARPLSLTELDRLITSLSYPSLERRLQAMRLAGQIEACPSSGRGTPYSATEWLRRAIGPLSAAARWERKYLPGEASPIGRLDIEAAFLLTVPMVTLPSHLSGICRMAVDVQSSNGHRLAGVIVDIREGQVASCASRLQGEVDAVATGSASAWLRAVIGRDPAALEISGDSELAGELVDNLHDALFSSVPES